MAQPTAPQFINPGQSGPEIFDLNVEMRPVLADLFLIRALLDDTEGTFVLPAQPPELVMAESDLDAQDLRPERAATLEIGHVDQDVANGPNSPSFSLELSHIVPLASIPKGVHQPSRLKTEDWKLMTGDCYSHPLDDGRREL